jgi:hypothetical protein
VKDRCQTAVPFAKHFEAVALNLRQSRGKFDAGLSCSHDELSSYRHTGAFVLTNDEEMKGIAGGK